MQTIKNVYVSGHNVLFIDEAQRLYIEGDNAANKTGIMSHSQYLKFPEFINFTLRNDETIVNFESYPKNIYLYTDHRRLIILPSENNENYCINSIPARPHIYSLKNTNIEIDPDDNTVDSKQLSRTLMGIPFGNGVVSSHSSQASALVNTNSSQKQQSQSDNVLIDNNLLQASQSGFLELIQNIAIDPRERSRFSSESQASQIGNRPHLRSIMAWTPLKMQNFNNLSQEMRQTYLDIASVRIGTDIAMGADWTQNEELLAAVLSQIELRNSENSESTIANTSSQEEASVNSVQSLTPPFPKYSLTRKFNVRSPVVLENVTSIIFGRDVIMYRIDVPDQSTEELAPKLTSELTPERTPCENSTINFNRSTRIIVEHFNKVTCGHPYNLNKYSQIAAKPCEFVNCRELCLPFNPERFVMTSRLIYCRVDNYHHVIIPSSNNDLVVRWIWFQTDIDVDPEQIQWSVTEDTLYVINLDTIYRYNRISQQLEAFISTNVGYVFAANTTNKLGKELILFDDYALYTQAILAKAADTMFFRQFTKSSTSTINDIHLVYSREENSAVTLIGLIVYDGHYECRTLSGDLRVTCQNGMLCINVRGLRYHGMLQDNCFVFIENDKLYVLGKTNNPWKCNAEKTLKTFSTMELLMFPLPVPVRAITNVTINSSIVIHTNRQIYYAHLYEQFVFRCISIEPGTSEFTPPGNYVNSRLFPPPPPVSHHSESSFKIYLNRPILPQFLQFIRDVPVDKLASINCYSQSGKMIGEGNRPLLIDLGLKSFATSFLITHNFVTTFNLDKLTKCTDSQLFEFGKMIVVSINNLMNHLPIRLPLLLVAAIRRRQPTKRALEFFAHKEDETAYRSLKIIENSPEQIQEAGFDDYISGLKFICKYDSIYQNMTVAYRVVNEIASGFLVNTHIEYINRMNMVTLDNYLSGDYVIDINMFMEMIAYSGPNEYRSPILNFIRNLHQDKLRMLLSNWTGTSVVRKSTNYHIQVSNSEGSAAIHFKTCYFRMVLHPEFFKTDPSMWEALLTNPCLATKG